MDSVLQNKKECIFCGQVGQLESHHCLHGFANRKKAEKYGLKVWLCAEHHRGTSGAHRNAYTDRVLKEYAQEYWERNIGTREQFITEFGKSYL